MRTDELVVPARERVEEVVMYIYLVLVVDFPLEFRILIGVSHILIWISHILNGTIEP